MKVLRALLAVIALFVLVCVIAVASLVILIDPNKLKPIIAQEVKKTTGYQLSIDGDLSWSFYPRIGVKIKHMSFNEPNQSQPFLDLNDVRIAANLSELIQGKFKNNKLFGKVYIDTMKLNNVNAKQVKADLHWQNNILTLQPIQASLYQGTLDGVVHGSHLSQTPRWDWEIELHRIEIQPLLIDLNGNNTKLSLAGVGDTKFVGGTQGKTKQELITQLSGSLELKVTRGVIDGVNLNYLIQTTDSLLAKKTANISLSDSEILLGQTLFDDFSANVIIEKGIAKTQNLTLKAPTFLATGKGSISLIEKLINFELEVKAEQNMVSSEQLKSFVIPVLISGSLNQPTVRLDMSEIRKLFIKEQIDQVKNKARDVINEHVPEKARDFFQKLIGE